MALVRVSVYPIDGVFDPEARVVRQGLVRLGFESIEHVRMGRVIELRLASGPDLDARVRQMCARVLVNDVIETYTYDILEA